jgi:hypothetical protein
MASSHNKITEHRAIFQREKAKLTSQQTDKISQQPENWENHNDPDLVQAFPNCLPVLYGNDQYIDHFVCRKVVATRQAKTWKRSFCI